MSYTFLLASGEVSSAECYSDIPVFAPSKSSRSAEKFSCNGNATESCPASPSGTTCEHSTANRGAEKSTASAEAFPAKTSLAQARARESAEREAGCGASSRVLLARFDPNTRLWKTLQCSLFGDSDECLETFPRSGMTQNGLLWELTTWAHPTGESVSGFWRTPDTGAGGEISAEKAADFAMRKTRASGSVIQLRLCDQVRHPQLWPTPTVCGNNNRKGLSKTSGDGLATAVLTYPTPNCSGMDGGSNSRKANRRGGIHQMLYPTPTRSDYKGRGPNSSQKGLPEIVKKLYPTPTCHDTKANISLRQNHQNGLGEVVYGGIETPQTKTARLNPNWVEWLMGWPIGWTDSKPLATDKFHSCLQQHLDY